MTALDIVSEFFPPTDRELALRGVIHTGWSTVAAKQPELSSLKVSKEDVAKIQEVLQKAEALERMEELRIGYFRLKHNQMVESCRGDGIKSCRICGINFAPQKGGDPHRASGAQLCSICMKGVCQRCKVYNKLSNGELQTLCHICADQKELWRRSGAWLNNMMPYIPYSDDDLLKMQEKQSISSSLRGRTQIGTGTLGRTVGSLPREFINPARHDSSDDDTDEEELEATPLHDLHGVEPTSKPTPESSPLPSLKFVKDLHKTNKPVKPFEAFSTIPRSQSSELEQKTPAVSSTLPRSSTTDMDLSSVSLSRSFTTDLASRHLPSSQREPKTLSRKSSTDEEESLTGSRSSMNDKDEASPLGRGLSRRVAISSRNKSKMEESRRRAKQIRDSRSPSSTSGNEGVLGDRSSSCKEESTASPSPVHVPQITLRRPTDFGLPSKQDSVESDVSVSEQPRESRVGSHDQRPSGDIELRTSAEESTPVTSPVKTTKVSSGKGDSLHYSTVEFAKTTTVPSRASNNDDLFAKVTPKKSSAPPSDVPRDTTVVHYSQVDFTKTTPKPVIKDTPPPMEFAKVKTKPSSVTPEPSQRTKMATITEVVESTPPVPHHRKESLASADKKSDDSYSPKVPSRSASLEKKGIPDRDTPPEPPARDSAPVPSTRDSPKEKRASLPSQQATPPPMPRSRSRNSDSNLVEKTGTDVSPKPRARARRSADHTHQVSDPSSSLPPLPQKDEPTAKPTPPQRQQKSDSPSVGKKSLPQLPPKEDPMPPLPLKDTSPAQSPPVTRVQPPLPPKEDTPTQPNNPPLPPKDDAPSTFPPLPPKDDSPAKPSSFPSLPPKDDSPVNPSFPPLPPKEESPKAPTPRSRTSVPKKDSPTKPEMPPHPSKDSTSPPLNGTNLLSASQPVTRGAKARSTIRNKAVMGDLLEEFRKKQVKVQTVTEVTETKEEEATPTPESSRVTDPSLLSDNSDAGKRSPGGSPLRRKNATRSGRYDRGNKPSSDGSGQAVMSGDDFPDFDDSSPLQRRRSNALRGRTKETTAADDVTSSLDSGRSRTRSRALSGMQRPVKRPARGRLTDESRLKDQEGPEDEFKRVSTCPRSQSPAPDGLCGSIEVCLSYEETSSQLRVTVVKCKGLRAMDANGLSDPYVNVFLAPRSEMDDMQTDIKFKTLNPEYNETFTFDGLLKSSLSDTKLHLVVMDYNEFSKDDFIGATTVNLYELLLAGGDSLTLRRLLDDMVPQQILKPREKSYGRIELKMTYSIEKERFTVHVLRAERLLNFGSQGVTCDPFMKCHICYHGHILKQKTKVCTKTVNPEFNEELHFSLKPKVLAFCRMTITVQDHKKLKDTFLGEVHFNAISFWRNFMSHPTHVSQSWYELRPRDFCTPQKLETVPYLPNRRSSAGQKQMRAIASSAIGMVRSLSGSKCNSTEGRSRYQLTQPRGVIFKSSK